MALARKGDFRAAELIYRAEAEYLLSADRKQQIADIYLEFADTYFKPPKEEQKPDYAQGPGVLPEGAGGGAEAGEADRGRAAGGRVPAEAEQARRGGRALREVHPRTIRQSPLDIEARYRLGECRLAEGNLKEARRVWQDLLAKYVDSQSERIAEAQFNLARTWQIPAADQRRGAEPGHGRAGGVHRAVPRHKLASQAHLEIAASYMHPRPLRGRGRRA